MEKLVSSWFNVRPLPEAYVFPPEQRPGKLFFPQGKSIPVLDLGGQDRKETIQLIMKASKEFGFFQVTNHGVSKDLIDDTLALAKEFHAMPAEDKICECSKDPDRSCKLYTSSGKYATEEKHYWRDCLIHPSHSFEKYMQFWPAKPVRYREVIGKYSIEVRKLSSKILELLSEGLKLSSGYFSSDLSESPILLINHYPPCPDPSLTLGLARHRDPGVVSIVLQGDVHGLQVFKDEEWIGVEPIPHAFVVNIGYVLQVIKHEVPPKLINDTMDVFKEFFDMPAEDKVSFYSENPSKTCKLYTSSLSYDREEIHLWRDNLRHPCHPLEECMKLWPEKPTRYREVVGAYSSEAKKLGSIILELIAEGLGLESGYFRNQLSESLLLSINHYPPCPNPSLTLGLVKHRDPNLITILLQGDVCGLQVLKDGEWIGVEPLPNAFVINIGYILQVISNNKLKSVEHRAVTNSKEARTSAALFINPANDCVIEPTKTLTEASNPPIYRAFQYQEFLMDYISNPTRRNQ